MTPCKLLLLLCLSTHNRWNLYPPARDLYWLCTCASNIFISQDLSQYREFSWIREVWCFPSQQGTELVWIDPVIKCSTFLVTILHCGEYIVTTPTNKRKRFRLFADRESQRTTLLIITYIQTCLYFPNSHPHDHDVSSKNIKYVFSITFSYTSNVSFIFLIS